MAVSLLKCAKEKGEQIPVHLEELLFVKTLEDEVAETSEEFDEESDEEWSGPRDYTPEPPADDWQEFVRQQSNADTTIVEVKQGVPS